VQQLSLLKVCSSLCWKAHSCSSSLQNSLHFIEPSQVYYNAHDISRICCFSEPDIHNLQLPSYSLIFCFNIILHLFLHSDFFFLLVLFTKSLCISILYLMRAVFSANHLPMYLSWLTQSPRKAATGPSKILANTSEDIETEMRAPSGVSRINNLATRITSIYQPKNAHIISHKTL